ncbi:MAG: class I SAM-dependent methyltransferase [Myxococcota bacterium]
MYGSGYHDAHYFREEEERGDLFSELEGLAPGRALLDFGCGDARFLRFAAERGWKGTGAEFDPSFVLRLRAEFPSLQFETVDEVLAQEDQSFSVIHLGDVFEHLVEPMGMMRSLLRRLKPGGLLFMEGPIEDNPNLVNYLMSVYFRRVRRSAGVHPPTHLIFTDRHSQLGALERLGLRTLVFRISDSPRPMPSRVERPGSVPHLAKFALGQVSVAVSNLVPGWGNRFLFVGSID